MNKDYIELLKKNDWNLFITFKFKHNPKDFNDGYIKIQKFFNNIKKKYNKMKFCGFSVGLNIYGIIHFHSLLTCKKSYPQTLNNIDLEPLQDIWDFGTIDIKLIYDNNIIINYISEKNSLLFNHNEFEIFLYRKNLILKLQEIKDE
jgi:hypothetical protein